MLGIVLVILAAAVVMFAVDRPRMDYVALLVLCVLPLTGVVEIQEALSGFSDPNIVLIVALFVVGEGLVRTGVAHRLGDALVAAAGHRASRLTVWLMATVCLLGSVMSSTAVTALFIPVVLRICRQTGQAAGRFMMPLSIAALISGMLTLVATAPNLVINSELIRRGEVGFSFFSFTPFGLPILVLGIVYMLVARRWLPDDAPPLDGFTKVRPTLRHWVEQYQLARREHRLRILPDSPLADKAIFDSNLKENIGANLVAIQRQRELLQPMAKTVLQVGDVLLLDFVAPEDDIQSWARDTRLEVLPLTGGYFTDHNQEIGMAELIVPADSELVGKNLAQYGFRTQFGISVIGLRRGVKALEADLKKEILQIGDTLLVIGPWKAIRKTLTFGTRDLLPVHLPVEMEDVVPVPEKLPQALAALALMLVLMISGLVSNVQAALAACLLMGACGCLDFERAYRAIDWKTIVLIVGMMPFSLALQRTGGTELASEFLVQWTAGTGSRGMLAALFLTTALMSMFISNTATAILMAPVAMTIAQQAGASPYPFAMTVALAASAAFMTPVSSPVNTLVVTPGGYRFWDFVKIGVPFTLLVMVVVVILVPWFLPF